MNALLWITLALAASLSAPPAPPLLPHEEASVQAGFVRHPERLAVQRRIPVVIVPHHLVASRSIGAVFDRLRDQDIRRVILLSPDHYDRCQTTLCTVHATFRTGSGVLESDLPALGLLALSPLVTAEPAIASQEHGIRFIAPFIRDALPNARIVSLVVQQSRAWETSREEIARLTASITDEHTLLVVSTDASHTLPLEEANAADRFTLSMLLSFNLEGLRTLRTPTQSDCPACLWLAVRRAQELGALLPTVVAHTNSATLLQEPASPDTTSHLSITFTVADAPAPSDVAVGGDVTVARGVPPSVLPPALRAFWESASVRVVNLEGPVRSPCPRVTEGYQFCNEVTDLKRIDTLATDWSVMNNHLADLGDADPRETVVHLERAGLTAVTSTPRPDATLRLLAVSAVMNPVRGAPSPSLGIENTLAALRADPAPSLLTIVLLHAGTEFDPELSATDRATARRFIDAGADAVVVGHSHVLGDVEFYSHGVILRGIGNLQFDQYESPATRAVRLVRVRKLEDGSIRLATMVGEVVRHVQPRPAAQ